MTVFRPRDHEGILLDPEAGEPAAPANGRQFTLLQVMKAIFIIAVFLGITVQGPNLGFLLDAVFFILILAVSLYGLSRLPYRVRLAIELSTAGLLLILSAWLWRPPWYVLQAERTEQLARLCSNLADKADGDRSRERFRREAAEYGRRARALKLQAMWYGLIRSVTKENPVAMTERELIAELGLSEALENHERIAEQTGIPKSPRWP